MCDFSLQHVKSRPAQVGDKLETRNFGTGTTGFCDAADPNVAVCLLPGTELAFDETPRKHVLTGRLAAASRSSARWTSKNSTGTTTAWSLLTVSGCS